MSKSALIYWIMSSMIECLCSAICVMTLLLCIDSTMIDCFLSYDILILE